MNANDFPAEFLNRQRDCAFTAGSLTAIASRGKLQVNQLTQSLREAGKIRRGAMKPSRVFRIDPKNDIVKVRGKLGLSQSKFAAILGISTDTLQNWEQGRREPTGPAKVLLKIAIRHPKVLLEVA